MADRKKPQTEPVMDNSAVAADPSIEKSKVVIALSKSHYNNVIRYIKRSSIDRVNALRTMTHASLKRLGIKRDLTKAVGRTPKGSSQGDTGTLFRWLEKISRKDRKAVSQLVAIDATACSRSN